MPSRKTPIHAIKARFANTANNPCKIHLHASTQPLRNYFDDNTTPSFSAHDRIYDRQRFAPHKVTGRLHLPSSILLAFHTLLAWTAHFIRLRIWLGDVVCRNCSIWPLPRIHESSPIVEPSSEQSEYSVKISHLVNIFEVGIPTRTGQDSLRRNRHSH